MIRPAEIGCHVKDPANAQCRIDQQPHQTVAGPTRLGFQHVVKQLHRRAQIGQHVVHMGANGLRKHRLISHGQRPQKHPIDAVVDRIEHPVTGLQRIVRLAKLGQRVRVAGRRRRGAAGQQHRHHRHRRQQGSNGQTAAWWHGHKILQATAEQTARRPKSRCPPSSHITVNAGRHAPTARTWGSAAAISRTRTENCAYPTN